MSEIYNFFGDIWDYLRETYFEVDFGNYKNFTFTTQGTTLSRIVFAIMIGCILAAVAAVYHRRYLGKVIRQLIKYNSVDEEHARTLVELGLARKWLLRRTLARRESALRKYLRYVGEPENPDPRVREHIHLDEARFYVPAHLKDAAAVRYEAKGSDIPSLILTVLVCLVGGVLLLRLLPVVLRAADNLITWLS